MKSFVLCMILLGVVFADEAVDRAKFEAFKKEFKRGYGGLDEKVFRIFQANMRRAEELNNAPGNLAEYGITQFMDMSREEFSATFAMDPSFLSNRHESDDPEPSIALDRIAKRDNIPVYYDWRNDGVVTPVYNQEQCGDCWAFSVTETIESAWALAGHPLVELSMQQLTSCDSSNGGCSGGNPPNAYKYVIKNGGIESFQAYPFTSGNGNSGYCDFNSGEIVASISNWAWVSRSASDESGMLSASYTYGPLSVCIDSSTWQTYKSGIITSNCGTQLDHCVQLTGWNTQNNVDYWIVRNSWGSTWGNAGYVYIQRNKNMCGIAEECTRACVTHC